MLAVPSGRYVTSARPALGPPARRQMGRFELHRDDGGGKSGVRRPASAPDANGGGGFRLRDGVGRGLTASLRAATTSRATGDGGGRAPARREHGGEEQGGAEEATSLRPFAVFAVFAGGPAAIRSSLRSRRARRHARRST